MCKFCVSTDSGCDLPSDYCTKRNIYAYKMKYSIGPDEFTDNMTPDDCIKFYDRMRKGDIPHTSQMTPAEFVDFWTELYKKYRLPIVHIALGSGISGTYANAFTAKTIFLESFPDAQIFLIDSTLASIGYGMLAVLAADMRDSGKSPQECVKWLEENKVFVNTYYTTDDLKYLYRSGRVSKSGIIVATALNIKPILNLDREGHLIVVGKMRGRKNAVNHIYDTVQKLVVNPAGQTVYICHSDCRADEVKSFSDTLLKRFGFKDSFINYIGPTIGSHSGPGLIACFFFGKARTMS